MAFAAQRSHVSQRNYLADTNPKCAAFFCGAPLRTGSLHARSMPHGREVRAAVANNLFEGQFVPSSISAASSLVVANGDEGALLELVEPTAAAHHEPLESLDDMAAFVERTRKEEETIRRRREEVELQLLRMRQQEAVRRQQAIKLKETAELASAAMLREQTHGSGEQPPAEPGEGAASTTLTTTAAADAGPAADATSAAGGPPRKKLMLKKSKRMSAVAAASGLHRVATPTPAAPASGGADRFQLGPGGGGVGKALLSREEMIEKTKVESSGPAMAGACNNDEECDFDEVVVPKPIFIISDCTGESAARTVRAALNQFEMRCRTQAPAQIMIYRFVESVDKMMVIIKEAVREDALVVFTLVDPKAVKMVQTACELHNVRYVDLWTALLDTMEVHLNTGRSGVPAAAETRKPKASLTAEYFKMIEAVEYTRKMDDGAHPQEWATADLVILGVSRCGKTPLSIYLGQRGFKVANLPLIPGCPVPKELYQIDQSRIVGLIIDPNVLATIRRNRVNLMGVSRAASIDYAEVKKINSELEWARNLYNSNPEWPVLDVTLRGIEETSARILKLLNDRRGDSSPQWVEEYHAPPPASADEGADLGGLNIPEMIYGANEGTFMMQGLY